MHPHSTLRGRGFSTRHQSFNGLTFVEFVGCLAAMTGGVAIGTMYLGIDLKTMAIGILEKAELIEPGQFARVNRYTTNKMSSTDYSAQQALADETRPYDVKSETTIKKDGSEELDGTASHILLDSLSETRNDSDSTTDAEEPGLRLTVEQRASLTRQYWKKLAEINHQESINRLTKIAENPNWKLFDYLTHRMNGHQHAADAIQALSRQGIDSKVLDFSNRVLQWHMSGVELNGQAVQLLTDAPSSGLTGPFAKHWQSAATQHRMEEKLLITRHQAVARYLQHAIEQ